MYYISTIGYIGNIDNIGSTRMDNVRSILNWETKLRYDIYNTYRYVTECTNRQYRIHW